MKIQKNNIEPSILELEKALKGIGKESQANKIYASKVNKDSLDALKTTKKLRRNWD